MKKSNRDKCDLCIWADFNKAFTLIRNQEQDWLSAWLSQSVIEESLMEMKCEVCGEICSGAESRHFPLSFLTMHLGGLQQSLHIDSKSGTGLASCLAFTKCD